MRVREHRDDVLALGSFPLCAALAHLLQRHRLDELHRGPELGVSNHRARPEQRQQRQPPRRVHAVGQVSQQLAQAIGRVAVCTGPNTTLMIASRVIACIRGHSSNGLPTGHCATALRATSAIIPP